MHIHVLGVMWFTESSSEKPIGIVFGVDVITKEKKAYIGTGYGVSSAQDKEHILKFGAKFPIDAAKILFKEELEEYEQNKCNS